MTDWSTSGHFFCSKFVLTNFCRYYHDGQDIEDVPGTIDATMDRGNERQTIKSNHLNPH